MSRLTFRGHKGYGLLKGKSCSYASHSFDCQLDEGVKLLDAAFEKLTQYEDLEEQGRLLGLPCKIGDTVWDIDYDKPHSYEVTGFSFGKLEEDFYDDVEAEKFDDDIIFYFRNSSGGISGYSAVCELGKAMFLTREEAEKALKEGQSKELMEEECL